MRPQGVALPILNCAVWLEREDDIDQRYSHRRRSRRRDSLPRHASRGYITRTSLNETTFESALEALLVQAKFRTSARRASADYRRHILSGLFSI
jgi:hypothetical protein